MSEFHGQNNQPHNDDGDEQLRRLLCQLRPPAPPKDLLPRVVRTSMRARRLAVIAGSRRGFVLGAASASVVCAVLAVVFLVPDSAQMAGLRAQASALFDDLPLIASNDSSFPRNATVGDNGRDQLIRDAGSQILNLTQADIRSQDVTAILNVPVDLRDAVVRISLDSGIELRDLPGLNVVEWKSDFIQGDNILNLSLATIEEDIDRFNSVQVRVSHPDYSTEIWINIAQSEHPGL